MFHDVVLQRVSLTWPLWTPCSFPSTYIFSMLSLALWLDAAVDRENLSKGWDFRHKFQLSRMNIEIGWLLPIFIEVFLA